MRRTLLLLLALALAPAPARAWAPADSADAAARLTRRDAEFALAAGAATGIVAFEDRHGSLRFSSERSRFALDLAADARRLGDPIYVGPALIATDALARLSHHGAVAAASERIGFSMVAAGAVSLAIKSAVGRWRPIESPGDPWHFTPLTLHDSFPSGHATVAFSFVSALDAETSTPWVPAIGYPAAALTAWSRVRDRRHWPSDVVAGAAIGTWVARRADLVAQRHWPRGLLVAMWPARGGAGLEIIERW